MALSLCLLAAWLSLAAAATITRVHLRNNAGTFHGMRQQLRLEATGENLPDVVSFLGIPYAEPPIGELRFLGPKAIERWGVRDALKMPNSCWQTQDTTYENHTGVNQWNANTEMSEDCLYLNIWVPADYLPKMHANGTSSSRQLAVLVWIYGGGFYSGTSTLDLYDGRILAAKNKVVVVSLQYRLGPLGFLYLGVDEAPGNAGLWDQQMALSWVNKHISCFGGDASRITIFGESAGATSVGFQILSPFSESLFKRAILQSGSALVPWGTIDKLDAVDRALRLAEMVHCPYKLDRRDLLVKCLQNVAAKSLVDKQFLVLGTNPLFFEAPFAPVVENGFLQNQPSLLLRQFQNGDRMQKDYLLGVNKNEAMYFLVYALQEPESMDPNAVSFFGTVPRAAPNFSRKQFMSTLQRITDDPDNILIDALAFEYVNHPTNPTDSYLQILDDLYGDYLFKCPTITFADALSEKNNVFFYSFEHQTVNLFDLYNWPEWMGVVHGYEIDYIFGVPFNNSMYTDEERVLSARMMDYWTKFAKTGNPNSDDEKLQYGDQSWPRYKGKKYAVFEAQNVDQSLTVRNGSVRHPKCDFWNQLINKWSIEIKAMKDNASRGCKCPRATSERLTSSGSRATARNCLLVFLTAFTIGRHVRTALV